MVSFLRNISISKRQLEIIIVYYVSLHWGWHFQEEQTWCKLESWCKRTIFCSSLEQSFRGYTTFFASIQASALRCYKSLIISQMQFCLRINTAKMQNFTYIRIFELSKQNVGGCNSVISSHDTWFLSPFEVDGIPVAPQLGLVNDVVVVKAWSVVHLCNHGHLILPPFQVLRADSQMAVDGLRHS